MFKIVLLSTSLALSATVANAQSGPLRLTPQQVTQVRANFLFVRACPSEPDPYAINEMGGDCVGGQSGAPQQSGGGGGGGEQAARRPLTPVPVRNQTK